MDIPAQLPPLTGSPKQVAWAERIRADLGTALVQAADEVREHATVELARARRMRVDGRNSAADQRSALALYDGMAERIPKVLAIPEAEFWITNRDAATATVFMISGTYWLWGERPTRR